MRALLLTAGALSLMCCMVLAGCLQRTDADLPPTSRGVERVSWEYAGSFGGDAEETEQTDDPWDTRYEPGGFRRISGLCVTDDEIWVCDLAISRLPIFDYEGRFKRQLGAGVPIPETLASDEQLYLEEEEYDYKTKPPRWEDLAGAPWGLDQQMLFKAADVAVVDEGFVLADQAMSGCQNSARRGQRIVLLRWDGTMQGLRSARVYWPTYLATAGATLAATEPRGNCLRLMEMTDERWPATRINEDTNFNRIMETELYYRGRSEYEVGVLLAANAGVGPGEFTGLGGIALAFDKLIACDTGNQRLQVFDTRREDFANWGTLIRVIPAHKRDGSLRFEAPRDIDIDSDGTIFVLDAERLEVAVLSPRFERLGSFGGDELLEPFALDASPDGRHCFVTDRRHNQVHHYVRGD